MRILLSIVLIGISFVSKSQITFEEVLSYEEKSFKEIQASLIGQYSIIIDTKEYRYYPIKKCNPPKFAEDSCQWKCIMPDYLDEVKSKYPLSKVVFKKSSNKNYGIQFNQNSDFAENYNSATKKATTFIYLNESKSWQNSNCRDEIEEVDSYTKLSIQFADQDAWNYFKASVVKNATFQSTWQSSNDSPIHLRYGIRRYQIKSGYWKGIFIDMYEGTTTYHVSITFNSYGVE